MSSFKKLNKADVTTVSYHANKRWSFTFPSSDVGPSGSINVYKARNEVFNINGTKTNGQYQSLVYSSINHLFYQSYSGSLLNTGSLMFNLDTYESASQQRPTGAYFDYNTNPLLTKSLPTNSNYSSSVININQNIFGSKILPGTLVASSSAALIFDDGNGNLNGDYELSPGGPRSEVEKVGNIFYAHGILVLTSTGSAFQNLLYAATSSISFQNEHIVYENEVRCIIRESDYNLSYNPTLLKYGGQYITSISGSNSIMTGSNNSFTLTGSFDSTVKDFATGSFFQPYVTTIGLYNDNNELLMVAKLAKPIALSTDTDMTFIVRYDT